MLCVSLNLFWDQLKSYNELLELVLNHIELVLMGITVFAFIYIACGVFPRGLRYVLGECGMNYWSGLKAMNVCRASRIAQRLFMEFALIKTEGRVVDAKGWSMIIDEFAIKLSKSGGETECEYVIANCMYLTNVDFSKAVSRYFDYLTQPRVKSFYSLTATSDYWVSKVKIDEAYVMPAILLSGLLARYEDNWEVFLSKYISTASWKISQYLTLRELYNVFAWLLWGPSREINWENGWEGLCQISYGDESNSIPAFLSTKNDVLTKMRNLLVKHLDDGVFGALCSVSVSLAPKKEYFRKARGKMTTSNSYFVDKISEDDSMSFVTQVSDFAECTDYRSNKYYCTAYLWILFEREHLNDVKFHPETSVAFFEHSNLADADTCRFLTDTLLNKAIRHFRLIYEDEQKRTRKYRFVCGFHRGIEKRCRERFAEEIAQNDGFGNWLARAVSFDVRHEPSMAFATIDNFFGDEDMQLNYEDVEVDDRRALADLSTFYATMYSDAFPVDDERESLPNIIDYIKRSRKTADWKFHVLLAKDKNGVIVGGVVFDYFARSNSVVVEFVVVDLLQRKRGLGTKLVQEVCRLSDNDAKESGQKSVRYMFCEVESPEIGKDQEMAHLRFWSRHWFRHLCFDYVQPPLSENQAAVHGLWFLGRVRSDNRNQNAVRNSIPASIVKSVLHDYVHFAMNIADPMSAPDYQEMAAQLDGIQDVDMVPIEGL